MSERNRELATVSEGCCLDVYGPAPPLPAVNRVRGGIVIASMGVTSDQPDEDVARLLHLLDETLRKGDPRSC